MEAQGPVQPQRPAPPLRVAAVILAAGQGARLGGVAKALIGVDGVPLVRRQIDALRGAGITDIVVVTGGHHDAIAPVVAAATGVRLLHNPDAASGQGTSVRRGLQAVAADMDAVLLVLCDQPLLTSADLRDLIGAFGQRAAHDFVVPRVDGSRRGNPVLASARVVRTIRASDRYQACRDYMDAHPESVLHMDTTNDHYVVDIDQPQDLVDVAARLGSSVCLPGRAAPRQVQEHAMPTWNYAQWAEHAAMEHLKGRLQTGDVLLAQANTLLSLLLVAIGGALAYAAALFEPEGAASPMAWGMAAVVAWLVVVAVNLVVNCIVTRPTTTLYNEPRNIYRPDLGLSEDQIRGFELDNVQIRIDRTKARNAVVAYWLDRCRYAAIATPFVFVVSAWIAR